jgi:hypothetical protein
MNEKQKPVTEKYKSNWDMIFGKKNTNVSELLASAQDLESKYKAGKLTAKEFKELVGDLRILQIVLEKSDEFENAQEARELLLDIVEVASAIK